MWITRLSLLNSFVHLHMYSYVRKYGPLQTAYVIQFHGEEGGQSCLFSNKKRKRWVHTGKSALTRARVWELAHCGWHKDYISIFRDVLSICLLCKYSYWIKSKLHISKPWLTWERISSLCVLTVFMVHRNVFWECGELFLNPWTGVFFCRSTSCTYFYIMDCPYFGFWHHGKCSRECRLACSRLTFMW